MDRNLIFVVGSFVVACSVTVEHLPEPGQSLLGGNLILEAGGKGFNIAVAARRLGVPVDGVLAVGNDPLAGFAKAALAEAALPEAMLLQFPGNTGAGVGIVDRRGENVIAVAPGANLLLSSVDIEAAGARLRGARFVVAQFEVGDAPILAAFAEAAGAGATTVLNPSPFRALRPELLALTDILVMNQTEAKALANALGAATSAERPEEGRPWFSLAQTLHAHGVETLIVTLGSAGAVAWRASKAPLFQPAFPVRAVDTIGAGDAFIGGLLAALSDDLDLPGALEWGAACGALATARLGLLGALATRAEVEEFIARAN